MKLAYIHNSQIGGKHVKFMSFSKLANQLNIHRFKTFLGCFDNVFKNRSTNSTYNNLRHAQVDSKVTFKHASTNSTYIS